MSEEVLLENDLTEGGLRRMHVMGMGEAPDVVRWREMVPPEAEGVEVFRTQEEAIGVHHLWFVWGAREVVDLTPHPDASQSLPHPRPLSQGERGEGGDGVSGEVVMWQVGTGDTLSWSIDLAATMFRLRLGRWPDTAWVRKLPPGAPVEMETTPSRVEGRDEICKLRIVEAGWVPKRFVVVGEEEGIGVVGQAPPYEVGVGEV